jgi:multidrug resistance protein, MATE family
MLDGLRRELRPMIALAAPVALAEIGWTTMGLVDTLMVGPLGPAAIGAVGLGSIVFLAVGIFGMGLLLGLDTLVAQAYGAGRLDGCRHWLRQGVYLAILAALPLTVIGYGVVATLPTWGLAPEVAAIATPYLQVVTLSLVPLLLYAAFRRYLQAMNLVRPVTVALLTANIVNAIVNWVLIYGRFGFPALGATGAAWATVLSRVYMAAALGTAIVLHNRRSRASRQPGSRRLDLDAMARLLRLGVPAGLQIVLEVAVFAAATALAGRLSAAALAAHQIALNIWAVIYMIPLGLNSAGAVRVGHAVGRRDHAALVRAGWTALALGAAFTATSALVFVAAGRPLIAAFSADADVLAIGPSLLAVAGVCLIFDGTQGIATGVLRGLGDTHVPMLTNLAGHWAIGLPLGYTACFVWGWGVQGLWLGLAAGLTLVGFTLLCVWARRARTWVAAPLDSGATSSTERRSTRAR